MNLNYWFLYDATTGVITQNYLGSADQWTNIPMGQRVFGAFPQSSASSTVIDAFNNPSRYIVQNSQLIPQPYFTLSSTPVSATPNAYTITATLKNVPATPSTSCTFTVASTPIVKSLINNQASITVQLHQSITNQSIAIKTSSQGCVDGNISIGGLHSDVGLQAYTPLGSTPLTIAPTGTGSKSFLQSYYALSPATIYRLIADIGTVVGLLTDAMFNIVIPTLQKSTYTPITLDTNQTNTFNDIKTNVLPNLYTTLENAYPSGSTKQVQYSDYETDLSNSYKAFQNYMNDLQNIPNLS